MFKKEIIIVFVLFIIFYNYITYLRFKRKYLSTYSNYEVDTKSIQNFDESKYNEFKTLMKNRGVQGIQQYKDEIQKKIDEAKKKKEKFGIASSILGVVAVALPGVGSIISGVASAGLSAYSNIGLKNETDEINNDILFLNKYLGGL